MQNAKDTFYEVLRARLAAVNPERTVEVRGVTRPALLVEENELLSEVPPPDCFRLRWGAVTCAVEGALPLVTLGCEVSYETAGSSFNGGMDRGRWLAAMDGELLAAVRGEPRSAAKMSYAGLAEGKPAAALATQIWWGEAAFGKTVVKGNRLARTATVTVMSYQEPGEL